MSELRPTLHTGSTKPLMTNGTAILMIYKAVETRKGLVHGKLHAHGEHCAIGSYFEINGETSLPSVLIDEVAAVNDSVPQLSERQRKRHVVKWLEWKLACLGMENFLPNAKKKIARKA